VCADLEEWLESLLCFDRGIEIAERIGDQAQIARLFANRAEPLLSLGDFALVPPSLARAEEIATRIGARATLADVARHRGRMYRLLGEVERAQEELLRGVRIASEAGLTLARAETMEEIGRSYREQGREAEAGAALTEAHAAFVELGAVRDAARVERLLTVGGLVTP
jgi:tetratricopeptide (TPR) repeat protein